MMRWRTVFAHALCGAKGNRNLLNAGDGIYQQSGGQTLLALTRRGNGYAGTFDIGLSLA